MMLPRFLVLLTLVVAPTASAQPAATADIHRVGWMAGHWIGIETEDLSEEHWLPPAANSMVGVWRWASGGRLRLFEMLTITREAQGVVMRLRHFRPDLTALEEKDKPFVLPLVRAGATEAIFEGVGSDGGPLRIGYKRIGDRLEATVERGSGTERFVYRLKQDRVP